MTNQSAVEKGSTVINDEINKFNSFASSWWDEGGEMALLHQMNPARIAFIKTNIDNNIQGKTYGDIDLLDVGCGAGILTEPLARMGFNVTGIDMAKNSIEIAKNRAAEQNLNIDYMTSSIEGLDSVDKEKKYDVITIMEIIEHVEDPDMFINACVKKLKPNGLLFFSTINRTWKSFASAIVGAEYITRIVPIGTHDWNKFITPAEITKMIGKDETAKTLAIKGMVYNPITKSWVVKENGFLDINYIGVARKN